MVDPITVDAVLFDNDGVLVDSHDVVLQAWTALAGEFDLEIDALTPELAGVRAIDTLVRFLPPDAAAAATARLEDIEVGLAAGTRPLAGASELLPSLPPDRWAIVTSASRRLAEARWRGAELPVPATTVTADDVSVGKPEPEPFLAAASALGVDPGRCVVFEDSPSGGEAGRRAGCHVIAVGHHEWEFQPMARVADLRAVSIQTVGPSLRIDLTL